MITIDNFEKMYRTEESKPVTLNGMNTNSVVSTFMRSWCIIYMTSLTLITLGMFFVKLIAN